MDNKKRPRPLIDDTYNLRPLGEDEEDTRLNPGTDVIEPAFDAREQALNEQQALTTDLSEQDLQTQQARDSQDLAMGITQGVQNIGQNALAPARGAVRSAFAQTDDMLGKSLDAQKQNRLDIRGMVADARRREDASQQNQANLRAQGIDLRQRLGMEPLAELQERIGLSKQLGDLEDGGQPQRRGAEWAPQDVEMEDGTTKTLFFNRYTGRYSDGDGNDLTSQVQRRAYAPQLRTDPVTGDLMRFQGTQVESAVPRPQGTETPRELNLREAQEKMRYSAALSDVNAEQQARRQEERKQREIAGKQDRELIDAESAQRNFEDFAKMFNENYSSGRFTGPGLAQLNRAATRLGFELDPNVNRADALAKQFGNQYIKQISGAQVSNKEREDLLKLLPNAATPSFEVESQLYTFQVETIKKVNEKRAQAGLELLPTPTQPSSGLRPKPGVVENLTQGLGRAVSNIVAPTARNIQSQAEQSIQNLEPKAHQTTSVVEELRNTPLGEKRMIKGVLHERTKDENGRLGWRPVK